MLRKRALVAATVVVVLTACGGGDGSGSGFPILPAPAPSPESSPAPAPDPTNPAPEPAPAPTPTQVQYKFFSTFADGDTPLEGMFPYDGFVELLNREGAQGFRFAQGTPTRTPYKQFMAVRDSDSAYSYEYKPLTSDLNDGVDSNAVLLAQMKEQGAKGMRYFMLGGQLESKDSQGNATIAVLYRKDSKAETTYDFVAIPRPKTSQDFLQKAQQLGAQGYRPWARASLQFEEEVEYFIKDMKSSARYDVRITRQEITANELKATLNAQGAQGYRFARSASFEDTSTVYFYVKDLTQSSTFEYEIVEAVGARNGSFDAAVIDQANALTQQGLRFFSNPEIALYFRSVNCLGELCGTPDDAEIGTY